MPNISVSVQSSGDVLSYEIAGDLTISTLKEFIAAETDIPVASQRLFNNGLPLEDDNQTLDAAGVKENDMLAVNARRQATSTPQQQQSRQPQQQAGGQGQGQGQPSDAELERIRQEINNNPQLRDQFRTQAPELAAVLQDPARFREEYIRHTTAARAAQRRQQMELDALDNDVTAENQEKIAEHIRQQAIEQQLQDVLEENPELFGRVTMLYIQVQVNGHPVKAFVDSGAQATIMSPSCAETCGVTRLIDKRFAGIARGVGTAKILGKVHKADIRIGDAELPCSFTVMEGKDVDMLLGLDMLKRYQACIDLAQNKLVLAGGSVSVPFLGESEIPKYFEEAMDNEPTVPGPGGSSIGAQSGAVKAPPAGAGSSAGPSAPVSAAAGKAPATGSNFRGTGAPLGSVPSTASSSSATQQPAPLLGRAAPSFPQESIDALVRLGASPEQAVELLRACDGNADAAASILFDQQFS